LEESRGDGVGEELVTGRVEVEVVVGVDRGQEPSRLPGVPGHPVEVDDGVEAAARADPPVDRLPGGLPVPGRVVVPGVALEERQGRSVHPDALGVRPHDDLFVGRDQIRRDLFPGCFGGLGGADVVDALEDQQPRDTTLREDVTVESGESIGPEPVVEHALGVGRLVEDRDPAELFLACNRLSNRSGQRLFRLVVEPRPSVSESPSSTAAAVARGDQVSTPLRKYQWSVRLAPGRSSSPTWLPDNR
jgi:hypothetical protein